MQPKAIIQCPERAFNRVYGMTFGKIYAGQNQNMLWMTHGYKPSSIGSEFVLVTSCNDDVVNLHSAVY